VNGPAALPAPLAIAIHDVHGRRVRNLAVPAGAASAGGPAVIWDGKNDAGDPVASGVYFARLNVQGRESVLRLVRTP
jgi:hypothetical protein